MTHVTKNPLLQEIPNHMHGEPFPQFVWFSQANPFVALNRSMSTLASEEMSEAAEAAMILPVPERTIWQIAIASCDVIMVCVCV